LINCHIERKKRKLQAKYMISCVFLIETKELEISMSNNCGWSRFHRSG